MNKIQENEFWIFIDDGGNIELTDKKTKYFTYAALLFYKYQDIENFREDYKKLMNKKYFKEKEEELGRELKGSDRIPFKRRKEIFDLIINSNCKLFFVIVDKKASYILKDIHNNFEILLKQDISKKQEKKIKHDRALEYSFYKTYYIGQLIAFIKQQVVWYRNSKINIISDEENLSFSSYKTMEEYLKKGQPYLKYFEHEYEFKMINSKDEEGIKGADFFANAIFKFYNKNQNLYIEYIQSSKEILWKKFPYLTNEKFNEVEELTI